MKATKLHRMLIDWWHAGQVVYSKGKTYVPDETTRAALEQGAAEEVEAKGAGPVSEPAKVAGNHFDPPPDP